MIDLVHWALLVLGLVYLVTEASILSLPRSFVAAKSVWLGTLLYCPACAGFWIGLVLNALDASLGTFGIAIESAIAGCAVGALWATIHPNRAVLAEAPLRIRFGIDYFSEGPTDDSKETLEDE